MNLEEARKKLRVVGQVPLLDGVHTPYHQFRDQFMAPNLPVVISGLMDQWRAFGAWTTPSGAPDLGYVAANFGNSKVQIAECSVREFTDQKRVNMTVADYIAYWKFHNTDKRDHDSDERELGCTDALLYLKDWHFVQDYPDYIPYSTPSFFMDDWLNLYLANHQLHAQGHTDADGCLSDYQFVYMGPKGTWTPLHADVLRSYSWSGNVCGKKLWHLLPPSETHLIFDRHMQSTVYNIYGDISIEEFPNFHKAGWLECTQERGQIVFVPSGWFHQVTNLEDTISINHNWINGFNLHWMWQLLMADYEETRASIEDIRSISDNFEELCQRNLAANSGMNFYDFFNFLRRMACFFLSYSQQNNSSCVEANNKEGTFVASFDQKDNCGAISRQILFNLQSIKHVAQHLALVNINEKWFSASSDQGRLKDSNWLCWVADSNHSYRTFLSKLRSPWVFPNMSGACSCVSQIDLGSPQSSKFVHEDGLQGDILDLYHGVVEIGSTNFEDKVNTPTVLVHFIEAIVNHITTCQ